MAHDVASYAEMARLDGLLKARLIQERHSQHERRSRLHTHRQKLLSTTASNPQDSSGKSARTKPFSAASGSSTSTTWHSDADSLFSEEFAQDSGAPALDALADDYFCALNHETTPTGIGCDSENPRTKNSANSAGELTELETVVPGTQEGLSTPPQDLSVIEEEMASSIDDDEPNSNTDHPHMRDTGHNFQEILKVEVTASTCKEVGFFPTGQNFFAVRESLSHFLDEEHKKCDRQESDHQRQCVLMRKRLQNLRGRIAAVNQRLDTVLLKDYGGKKFANIPFTSDEQSERKSESGESEIEVNEDLLSVRPFSEASAVVRRNLEHFGGLLTSVNAENERWERWRGAMADLYEEKTRVLLSDMPVTEMTDTVAVADPSSPSGMKTVEGGGDVLKDNEVNAKMRQLQRLTKSANRKLGQIRRLTRNNNHDLISGEH